jgi:hypothetical protein
VVTTKRQKHSFFNKTNKELHVPFEYVRGREVVSCHVRSVCALYAKRRGGLRKLGGGLGEKEKKSCILHSKKMIVSCLCLRVTKRGDYQEFVGVFESSRIVRYHCLCLIVSLL